MKHPSSEHSLRLGLQGSLQVVTLQIFGGSHHFCETLYITTQIGLYHIPTLSGLAYSLYGVFFLKEYGKNLYLKSSSVYLPIKLTSLGKLAFGK